MRALMLGLCALGVATTAQAEVLRMEVASRAPAQTQPGHEILIGRFFGELDPRDPRNAVITDIQLAPRNARGMVEYSATFEIAKPVDLSRASGFLFYNVPNRGNGRATPDADGHIRVVSGWQSDLAEAPGRQTLRAPIARNRDGSPITGPHTVRFVDMPRGGNGLPLLGGIGAGAPSPLPFTTDTAKARLVRKRGEYDAGEAIPARDFAFGDCRTAAFPGTPDPTRLCLRGGFDPAHAYELTYTAKDPLVQGIGFAATRDLNTFLRSAPASAGNPVAGGVKWTIAVGVSQSGNYLRTFLNLGFNQGEDGKRVFDGMNPQIAGRQVPLNLRFGVPGGAASLYDAGSEGALWWSAYDDRTRGLGRTSLLDSCNRTNTCPRIFETFGSTEFWGLRMSPNLVGTDAARDIPLPANVRRYYFPSVTHGSGNGAWAVVARTAPGFGQCALPANPNSTAEHIRALQKALEAWVARDEAPPPSLYPTLAKGELVLPTAQHLGFPAIPGAPAPDGKFKTFLLYDFGPTYLRRTASGVISKSPPTIGGTITSLVPRVDADGNEVGGVRTPWMQVPLGTYLGWNVQASGYYAGQQCGFQGGYIPFAQTRAERMRRGDPRPSLEERYGNHQGFVDRVRAATQDLVRQRLLLPEDAARIVREADASSVLK